MRKIFHTLPLPFYFILFLGSFLLLYRLHELMMFIGDFAWFYLSARDMIISGNIPLVGIPSSHPWLHQGAIWTYLLVPGFIIANFHPLSGAYTAVLFGIGSIILVYLTGRELFGQRMGLISALLYGTSPLIIIHARMPYHTSPIPFFTLLFFYSLIRWRDGHLMFFPLILFTLVILYQLELATIIYAGFFLLVFGYGLVKRMPWVTGLRNSKIIFFSLAAGMIPLIPILLYDFSHGFPQTVKFAAWIGYKILTVFGYPSLHPDIPSQSLGEVFLFFVEHIRKILFLPNILIGVSVLLVSIGIFGVTLFRNYRTGKVSETSLMLGVFFLIGVLGFFIAKTTSEAYLPMLFPAIILIVAYSFDLALQNLRIRFIGMAMLIILTSLNVLSLLTNNYLMAIPQGGYGPTLSDRIRASRELVTMADGKRYTIKGMGSGSEYGSFTMSTEYLTWWLGNAPVRSGVARQFLVTETPEGVSVEEIKK